MEKIADAARLVLISPVILAAISIRCGAWAWARGCQAALVAAGICTPEDFRA